MRSEIIHRLEGCFTALVTPFHRTAELNVDFSRLKELITRQADGGVAGVVLCGTTGESATLTEIEHGSVLEIGIRECHDNGLLAIAGTGSNSTKIAVEFTRHAKALGADAALVVTPYYNKPDEAGLRRHFAKLNDVGLPIILYNIPSRTGVNLSPALLVRLCLENDQVVGIKASNGDLNQIIETVAALRHAGSDVKVLSGDDSLTVPIMAVGGVGAISVISNIFPQLMVRIVQASVCGDAKLAARFAQDTYILATRLLQIGSNPAAAKALLRHRGVDCGGCREPLVELTDVQAQILLETCQALEVDLAEMGILLNGEQTFQQALL